MEKDLIRELKARGTAKVTDGIVNQVTQAIDENEGRVKFLIFGEIVEKKIIPIEKACAKCNWGKSKFGTIGKCQEHQKRGGEARGFHKLICPEQFEE